MAGIMRGVAWLIPYCARHHPLQSEKQRVPGTPSASFLRGGERLGWPSLRASTEHSIRLGPEPINPECAMREHGGLAWPPRPPHPSPAEAAFPKVFTARKPEEPKQKKGGGPP